MIGPWATACLLLASGVLSAQDFAAGHAAYLAGDYATALREWTPLAEQGDADVQARLGDIYLARGDTTIRNHGKAARWFRAAAEQGHARAQSNLGVMYDGGLGVRRNPAEAARWYRAAAIQGLGVAQFSLGKMYARGNGVPRDDLTALVWFKLAVNNDFEFAVPEREVLAQSLTSAEVAEAERRARICMSSGYRDCD